MADERILAVTPFGVYKADVSGDGAIVTATLQSTSICQSERYDAYVNTPVPPSRSPPSTILVPRSAFQRERRGSAADRPIFIH